MTEKNNLENPSSQFQKDRYYLKVFFTNEAHFPDCLELIKGLKANALVNRTALCSDKTADTDTVLERLRLAHAKLIQRSADTVDILKVLRQRQIGGQINKPYFMKKNQ